MLAYSTSLCPTFAAGDATKRRATASLLIPHSRAALLPPKRQPLMLCRRGIEKDVRAAAKVYHTFCKGDTQTRTAHIPPNSRTTESLIALSHHTAVKRCSYAIARWAMAVLCLTGPEYYRRCIAALVRCLCIHWHGCLHLLSLHFLPLAPPPVHRARSA
jgi:hypothetical protein